MGALAARVERPATVDAAGDGQLAFGAGGAAAASAARDAERVRGRTPGSLSERLRAERGGHRHLSAVASPADGAGQGTARGGAATLDELLVGAWEGLSAHRPVACPVCAGPMVPRVGSAGGGCGDCGSQLR